MPIGGPFSLIASCCPRTRTMYMSGTMSGPAPGLPPGEHQHVLRGVQTVDPCKATGKLHMLWGPFAKFYEDNGQLDDTRIILESAAKVSFKQVDDLASVWCECGPGLRLLWKVTALPALRAEYFDGSVPVQNRVHKSLKVWSLLADLEESHGTFQSTKAEYDSILDLRIATNYAIFLEEHKYFKESFKAKEHGILLFKWPTLTKFITHYGRCKLERAQDLFEQGLDGCPPQICKDPVPAVCTAGGGVGPGPACNGRVGAHHPGHRAHPAVRHLKIYIKQAAEIYESPTPAVASTTARNETCVGEASTSANIDGSAPVELGLQQSTQVKELQRKCQQEQRNHELRMKSMCASIKRDGLPAWRVTKKGLYSLDRLGLCLKLCQWKKLLPSKPKLWRRKDLPSRLT
ncbi:hypothetical protein QTO34_018529 [Cnephaeus nilssonii]|uniref:Pre-mRNA-splicing factor Syf1/CRNKL1-like C-terminal HAT-repeats domain-containing protein n=1 Tax=Cnephaeus nilssonii TaxID=3371016 RepID=A0AA40HZU1_CNENI|nr:hypothetical protein QTO34_018529 [Eptesicus nilssonii]